MKKYKIPVVCIIIINHRIEWLKSYGITLANTINQVSESTKFQAALVNKPFTADAALKLVELKTL